MDIRDAGKPILLLSLLFTACIGHVPGKIIGPLDSKLNRYQSTVSTEVTTEIYYVTDQPTKKSTSSVSTGTTGIPLLDPTLPPSSESPSQTTAAVFATLTRPTRESTKTISILTSLQKTTISTTGSYSPFTSATKNPPFQATSEHFSTGDSKFTSPSQGHTNLFVTSSSLASTHQSGTSSRMMTTLAGSNQSHSMFPKTESMRTSFPRTEGLRTEPLMRNGHPGRDEPHGKCRLLCTAIPYDVKPLFPFFSFFLSISVTQVSFLSHPPYKLSFPPWHAEIWYGFVLILTWRKELMLSTCHHW